VIPPTLSGLLETPINAIRFGLKILSNFLMAMCNIFGFKLQRLSFQVINLNESGLKIREKNQFKKL
jgi:hypothetical protein